jgi:hypothetical protein
LVKREEMRRREGRTLKGMAKIVDKRHEADEAKKKGDPIDQSGSRLVGDEVVVEEHRLEGFVSQFAVNETINEPTSEAGDDICEILT